MYLKSIEIAGFKSFAKRVELDFASKVSAIVGPNGSGKSNIAESFRFVLGEQSIKSLRGKRGEDLIWNGSAELPRAGKASVKVTFDNTSRFLDIDFDTVTIERAVHRDGVNEYFLNNSQVRLKDIIELLAGAHVGSSGHHIISQGEADRILNAGIKERKTMIEEALGLKVYQYKKVESLKKLEKTTENIDKVQSLRREIAPHIKFLKKQVEKVEKAAFMKTELAGIADQYFTTELADIEHAAASLLKERTPLQSKLEAARKEVSDAKDVLKQAETRDVRSDELLKIESSLREVRVEKDEKSRERGMIEGELAAAARLIKKQEETAHATVAKTVEMQAVEMLRDEILVHAEVIEKSANLEDIRASIAAIKSIFKAFIDMRSDMPGSGMGTSSLIHDTQLEIEKLSKLRDKAEQQIAECVKKEKEMEHAYDSLRKKIEHEKETDRDAEKRLFQSMSEEKVLISELHEVHAKEETLHVIEDEYKRDLGEISIMLGKNLMDMDSAAPKLNLGEFAQDRNVQKELRQQIEKIKIRLEDAGGAGGDEVLKEYTEALERDQFFEKELMDLSASAESLQTLITELDDKISEEFESGLHKINKQFQDFFVLMFGGGEASLSVIKTPKKKKSSDVDELLATGEIIGQSDMAEEPEADEGGIDISVSLPRKKTKGLIQLSGGERALTSIALLFAISQVNPPPFIILDETDAALDEANSKKYGDMIETLSKYSQLIVITHNRETMSRAGVLYGVTMGQGGVSKLLSVAFEEAVAVAK